MSTFNQTNTTNFVMEVNDAGLTNAFKLNIQSSPIASIRVPVSDVPGSTQGMHRSMLPGSTTEFEPLTVRFLVDENLEAWLDMYKWMLSINNYVDRDRSGWHTDKMKPAVTFHVLDNDKTNIVMSVHYYGAWCSDLSEIEFSLIEDTDIAMTCTAIMPFKYFEVEKDGIIITGRQSIDQAGDAKVTAGVSVHPSMR